MRLLPKDAERKLEFMGAAIRPYRSWHTERPSELKCRCKRYMTPSGLGVLDKTDGMDEDLIVWVWDCSCGQRAIKNKMWPGCMWKKEKL